MHLAKKSSSTSKKYPPGSFMGKLRKRKIIQTVAAFVGGGVAAVEFVYHILVHNYHFPKYTTDITIVVIALAMICTVSWRLLRTGKEESEEELKIDLFALPDWKNSIVVLPFENISPEEGQDYFCDGMTEEIITDLSSIHDLRVISRSSAMVLKGSKKAVRDIAKESNVQYVLEGSVRKAGNDIRITAQLIDATSDAHLWAEKYSGTLDDVFDIQEKISRSIVEALKLKLTPEEKREIPVRFSSKKLLIPPFVVVAIGILILVGFLMLTEKNKGPIIWLVLFGFVFYRYIRNRKNRMLKRFAKEISKFPEVRAIIVRGDHVMVVVDQAKVKLYIRINRLIDLVNKKLYFGGNVEAAVRDDLSSNEFQRILREPRVIYIRDDVILKSDTE